MPEERASRDGLLYLKEEELRSVLRNVPISDVYCVEDTVFARGKFATVRRALHKTTRVQYAAKYIKKRRRNVNMVPEIYHEISVLLKCSSNNRVVRLYEVYETNSDIVLVLGLAAGGELQRIFDGDQCLGEIEARRAMRQILEGLCFLHERNIAHLDLKPQNILLTVEDSCDDIKLCDFGISRLLEPGTEVRTLSGTPDYVAPEVVSYEPISLATDIWSVGVLAYVLLSGYTPFGADTKEQTSLNISKGIVTFEPEDFVDVSSVALDFIKSILVLNPKQRPTVQELLQHPWITPQSHILPSLSLKTTTTSSDTMNITPKSTPINQRKSLPCPPEATAPTNNTRTTFKSDNLNENVDEIKGDTSEFTQFASANIDIEHSIVKLSIQNNKHSDADCTEEEIAVNSTTPPENFFANIPCNQESEVVTPNDVLSEISSEEIEENFYLLKSVEKLISDKEHCSSSVLNSEISDEKQGDSEIAETPQDKIDIITSNFDVYLNNENNICLCKSCDDILSDSGIINSIDLEINQNRFKEISNDIEENNNETCVYTTMEERHDEISQITINFNIDLDDEDTERLCDDDKITPEDNYLNASGTCSVEETFVNTYEVDKQIFFSLNCSPTSENVEEIAIKEPILINSLEISESFCNNEYVTVNHLEPIEIFSSNSAFETAEEIEYSEDTNKVFVNTYEIKDNKSEI